MELLSRKDNSFNRLFSLNYFIGKCAHCGTLSFLLSYNLLINWLELYLCVFSAFATFILTACLFLLSLAGQALLVIRFYLTLLNGRQYVELIPNRV